MNTTAVTPDLNKFTQVELHIMPDPAFTRKFGKRVKQAGGSYSAVRGLTDTRYVFLPLSEAKLIDEIILFTFATFTTRRTAVMIARDFTVHRNRPAWVEVHYVSRAQLTPAAWLQRVVDYNTNNAIERNIFS